MNKMLADVEHAIRCGHFEVLLLDGFTVLNYAPLLDLMDLKYFFLLPKHESWARRQQRVYEPPDPPGYFDQVRFSINKCHVLCAYLGLFAFQVVWPEHQKHVDEVKCHSDVVFLDGMNFEKEALRVENDIRCRLVTKKAAASCMQNGHWLSISRVRARGFWEWWFCGFRATNGITWYVFHCHCNNVLHPVFEGV